MNPASFKENENFRDFYESVAVNYPEQELVYRTLRGKLRRKFIFKQLDRFQGTLLDLGCNRGHYCRYYKNGPAVGVDIAFNLLKFATDYCSNAVFIQGDIQNLAFVRDNVADAILCSEVIEHVPFPERVFSGCFRALRPGGALLMTTPNYKGDKRPTWMNVGRMKMFGIRGVRDDNYFHTAYRPEELRRYAEKAGFVVCDAGTLEKEVKYATRIPVLFYYLFRLLNRASFRSEKLDNANERMLEKLSLWIYELACLLKLNRFLTALIREGVRSYVICAKPVTGKHDKPS